jgi:hypothetical protein
MKDPSKRSIYLLISLATNGHEESTTRIIRFGGILREVWAPNHNYLDLGIDNQRHTDGVLFSTKEALNSITLVKTPEF